MFQQSSAAPKEQQSVFLPFCFRHLGLHASSCIEMMVVLQMQGYFMGFVKLLQGVPEQLSITFG
jgi:hypothetical protein